MSPWLEIVVATLDILSFLFVTPLVLTHTRLLGPLLWLENANNWIRADFFDQPEAGGGSLASACGMLLGLVLVVVMMLRGPTNEGTAVQGVLLAGVAFLLPTLLAFLIMRLYAFVAWSALRFGIERTLAIIGAGMFMSARIIVIVFAVQRLV